MAQAKRKTATKTKKTVKRQQSGSKSNTRTSKQAQEQKSNMFFVVSMSFLAATLLFSNLLMMNA